MAGPTTQMYELENGKEEEEENKKVVTIHAIVIWEGRLLDY